MTNVQLLKELAARGVSYPLFHAWAMWLYHLSTQTASFRGEKYFCQNAGSCGSMYIVELLKSNGYHNCYHEKRPDLDALGIDFYEGKASANKLRAVLIHTRKNVFFEANNRLFSMSRILKEAFPDAKFIHLHRDPRDKIPSALSKPTSISWDSRRRRYTSVLLNGPASGTVLEKACYYWANYNCRIFEDLQGEDYLSLKFSDLVAGNLDALEAFMDVKLQNRQIAAVNAGKPVRKEGKYDDFEEWPSGDQNVLHNICGPMMERLGYSF